LAQKEQLVILTTFSREPLAPLVEEFNRIHQDVEVKLIHRRTSSSIQLLNKSYIDNIDLLLTSSPYLMSHMIKAGKLVDMPVKFQPPVWLKPYVLPSSDKAVTIGYSGAGIVWNQDYLDSHALPKPTSFVSLSDPVYFGHVTMSTPSRSGTTQMMLESVLTRYGWQQGWRHILNVAANFATISSRSFGVSDTIAKGSLGLGPTIDSYANILQRKLDYVEFVYDKDFTLMPTYIGMLKQNDNDTHTFAFIEMLLSEQTQREMRDNSFSKYSIKDDRLAKDPHVALNVDTIMQRELGINLLFDVAITKRLAHLNDTWLSIIKAELRFANHPEKLAQIEQIKALTFTLPISEEDFDDQTEFLLLLKKRSDERSQATFAADREEWLHSLKVKLNDNLAKANAQLRQLNSGASQ